MYTRLQTVWSLPGPSRQASKGHSPRCHRRPNGPGRLADKVVQPTTQSAEGCTYGISYSMLNVASLHIVQCAYITISARSVYRNLSRSSARVAGQFVRFYQGCVLVWVGLTVFFRLWLQDGERTLGETGPPGGAGGDTTGTRSLR